MVNLTYPTDNEIIKACDKYIKEHKIAENYEFLSVDELDGMKQISVWVPSIEQTLFFILDKNMEFHLMFSGLLK